MGRKGLTKGRHDGHSGEGRSGFMQLCSGTDRRGKKCRGAGRVIDASGTHYCIEHAEWGAPCPVDWRNPRGIGNRNKRRRA